MEEFNAFKKVLQKHFETISTDVGHLFTVDIDRDEIINVYLDSFPEGTNEIYRVNREYDCSACKNFIRNFGNVVVIKDNIITTIWDVTAPSKTFQTVANAMSKYVKSRPVDGVYVKKELHIGTDKNLEQLEDGTVLTWQHLYIDVPKKFVYVGSDTIDTVRGNYKAVRDVFKRSLDELSLESIDTVLELINSNTLYKGEEWKGVMEKFRKYKVDYDTKLTSTNKHLFAWEKSVEAGPVIGKIRNHSIGTLLIDITKDMDLDEAVRRYEVVVAPTNYKRPKAIFTKQMLEDAKKTVEDLGYMESLARRFATLDDITVNNILFCNRDASKRIKGSSDMFDELSATVAIDPKAFSRVEEVPIDKFIKDVLPTVSEVEVYLDNKLSSNMVSLIAPVKSGSKSMFKWNNAFSWAYTGNITDSDMKQNVKMAGGNVDGVLRFSIQWNDGSSHDHNDLDAHCIEPTGNRIYFASKAGHASSGSLDVDIRQPSNGVPAVENIVYTNINAMPRGKYSFMVHQYANRGGKEGFSAEIEFGGQIYEFSYPREVRQGEFINVADVTWDGQTFTMKEMLDSRTSSREVWGVNTNQFVPVTTIMYSPNYWDEQDGIGHRHVMFMIQGCVNDQRPNGFYNEFLKQELYEHKRVFEALSSKSSVPDADALSQLSGIGFSTTKRASVIVKVKSVNVERTMKVTF